jgi:hypothetical protein
MGRHSEFTEAIGDIICERIAGGESLRKICESEEMPCQTAVFQWLKKNDDFAQQYARAREAQADYWADEIVDIADDKSDDFKLQNGQETFQAENVQRSKLRVDARKWIASKLKPRKYGEFVRSEVTGKDGEPLIQKMTDEQLDKSIRELASKIGIIPPA